jgi:hypothetical protein
VAEQQPEDLTTGIAAGTGDGHRSHALILHAYAYCCKSIKGARCYVLPDRRTPACLARHTGSDTMVTTPLIPPLGTQRC